MEGFSHQQQEVDDIENERTHLLHCIVIITVPQQEKIFFDYFYVIS